MINQSDLKFMKINENIYKIMNKNSEIQILLKNITTPFGLEKEYNKYKLKLDITDDNDISVIYFLENIIKNIFKIEDEQLKSVIRKKTDYNDLLICNLKTTKDSILVNINYLSEKDYLKTVYDLVKGMTGDYMLCVESLWYYPDNNKKVGLNLYIKNIIVH